MDLKGKKVTIVGLAREGTALAIYATGQGATVTISDSKAADRLQEYLAQISGLSVTLSLGGNKVEDTTGADIVFVSPGVPKNLPCLIAATEKGIPISSETKLFFEMCSSSKIAITGSSGKTTTTTLIGEILAADGKRTFVGGNIGTPLINQAAAMDRSCWAVLELSSFQLETMQKSPDIAVITNITPNHLDVHPSMNEYIEAKFHILAFQSAKDHAVLNFDDPLTRGFADRSAAKVSFFSTNSEVPEGAFIRGSQVIVRYADAETTVCSLTDIKLLGKHNIYNVLAASAASTLCGVSPSSIFSVVSRFTGVQHRLEPVAEINGVRYYNDSIATSPERTMAALNSFDAPIVLLLGGRDKHLPMEDMATKIVEKCRCAVLFGEAIPLLRDAISKEMERRGMSSSQIPIVTVPSFSDIARAARENARSGDVVLLSPACTSYDQFRDFEERGREFRRLVLELVP